MTPPSGDAGQRLEPVREMRRAVLNGPVLHRIRHRIGNFMIQSRALIDGFFQRSVNIVRKSRFHNTVVKDLTSEILRYGGHRGSLQSQ